MHAVRRFLSRVLLSRFSPLAISATFRQAQRVVRLNQDIAELEAQSKFDEARTIRDRALSGIDANFSTPLLRSRGFDLLRLGRMPDALEAFEAGIRHLDQRALVYGVSAPDELYYGAALAAFRVGEIEKSREYYQQAVAIIARMRTEFPEDRKPGWWDSGLEMLNKQLEGVRSAGPKEEGS